MSFVLCHLTWTLTFDMPKENDVAEELLDQMQTDMKAALKSNVSYQINESGGEGKPPMSHIGFWTKEPSV